MVEPDGMLVGLTGRIVRGQAISEYLEKGHQMGAHVILNVENVEGVASGGERSPLHLAMGDRYASLWN